MAAMRAFDRGAALVRLRITCLDAAFVFDRRRTGPDRLAVGEGAEAFVADRKRIAFLQRRILVNLVEQDLADRPAGQVVRAAGAGQGEEAALAPEEGDRTSVV